MPLFQSDLFGRRHIPLAELLPCFSIAKPSDLTSVKAHVSEHGIDSSDSGTPWVVTQVLNEPREPYSAIQNPVVLEIDEDRQRFFDLLIDQFDYWRFLGFIQDPLNHTLKCLYRISRLGATLLIYFASQVFQQSHALITT